MKRLAPFILAAALAACSSQTPYTTTTGELQPSSTLTVHITNGDLNAYKPAVGEPATRFTVAATALPNQAAPASPVVTRAGTGIIVSAPNPLSQLLVRVPDRVDLVVVSKKGAVNVTDVTGNVTVSAGTGDVHVMVPGYAQAATQAGHLAVTFGASEWPGVLKFSNGNGDIEVYIPEIAKFHVHLHTDDGTLFSDFGLKGTSNGSSETIDGNVNGGGSHGVDIEAKRGTIRLLRLAPQA